MTQSPSLPKPDVGPTDDEFGYTADQMNAHGLARYEAGRAADAQAVPEGLSLAQEPKYTVNGSAIVNRASGEAIPADEPVFIFRARDWKALHALREYQGHCVDSSHRAAVTGRIQDFKDFAAAHPERMREPDTAPTRGAEAAAPQVVAPERDFAFLRFPELYAPEAVVGETSEDIVDQLCRAHSSVTRLHAEYQGKAMSDDVYDVFATLRDDRIPALKRAIRADLTPSPTPTAPQEADLRENAERYLWLRDKSTPPHNFYISVPVEFAGVRYTPDEVDAGIDAARAALAQQQSQQGEGS